MLFALRESAHRADPALGRRTAFFVVLMWVAVGVVHALARYADIVRYDLNVPFRAADVGYFVLSYVSWVLITLALLRALANAHGGHRAKRLCAVFLIGIVLWLPCYFAYDYGVATLTEGGGWSDWVAKYAATSGSVVFFYAVVYALTFAVCVGITEAQRARAAQVRNLQLEQQRAATALALSAQQMEVMQSQLSPHFLFNSLGAISYLARSCERGVLIDAVARLGGLLRFTVENASKTHIALREELAFANDYIALQVLRFGDRFTCQIDADPKVDAQCLPFSLQPLLENVFHHAVEHAHDPPGDHGAPAVQIHITVTTRDEHVSMRVCNNRPSAARDDVSEPRGLGTGIKNLEARLAHTYGDQAVLHSSVKDAMYCVELTFPAQHEDHAL